MSNKCKCVHMTKHSASKDSKGLVLKVAKSSNCSKRRSLGCGSSGVSTSCLRVKRQAYSASMRI